MMMLLWVGVVVVFGVVLISVGVLVFNFSEYCSVEVKLCVLVCEVVDS